MTLAKMMTNSVRAIPFPIKKLCWRSSPHGRALQTLSISQVLHIPGFNLFHHCQKSGAVKAGAANAIVCEMDMSRMGRDYLKVGQIMEILRQRGVRLIANNDGVDSARGDDDFPLSATL